MTEAELDAMQGRINLGRMIHQSLKVARNELAHTADNEVLAIKLGLPLGHARTSQALTSSVSFSEVESVEFGKRIKALVIEMLMARVDKAQKALEEF